MKQYLLRFLLFALFLVIKNNIYAEQFDVNGIGYKTTSLSTVEVVHQNGYNGDIIIPELFNVDIFITDELEHIYIECFVDSIAAQADKKGFTYTLKVKNKLCELFENNVAPKIYKNFA